MANFKQVNKALKTTINGLDIEVVRGEGYVYFCGDVGIDIPSVYSHPTSTTTDDMIRLCRWQIEKHLGERS